MLRELPRRYPLLLPISGMVFGIYASAEAWIQDAWMAASLLLISALGAWRLRPPWKLVALAGFGFALGGLRTPLELPRPLPSEIVAAVSEKRPQQVEFRIEEYPRCDSRRCQMRIRLDSGVQALLKVWQPQVTAIPGEIYRASLRFSRPRRFHNPHSFDYPRYLSRQGISVLASVKELPRNSRLEEASWLYRKAAGVRGSIGRQISERVPEGAARGVLTALLLGNKQELSIETEESFRRSGLTHVLVVSGLHFSLMGMLWFFPCWALLNGFSRLADRGTARVMALGLAGIPAFSYALLVGLTPSVLRALGAISILGLALGLRWRKDFSSSLLLIAGVLLLVQPLFWFDLSFQLSFGSVAAIYFLGKPVQAWLEKNQRRFPVIRHPVPRWALLSLYSTCAVNFALFPILAASFHEISLLAPLTNLLGVPFFASFLLPAEGIVAFTAGIFPPAAFLWTWLEKIMNPFLQALHFLSDLPWTTWFVGPLPVYFWPAYFLALAAGSGWVSGKQLYRWTVVPLLLALCCSPIPQPSRTLTLTMFDVGQGESLLLVFPNQEAILIDGGGFPFSDFDVGRNILLPELLAKGVRRLSALVLTHPDADHWKGLRFLADRFPVGEFWVGPGTDEHPAFASLKKIIEKRRIPMQILSQGDVFSYDGAVLEVLWPTQPAAAGIDSDNNLSLVLRACHQGRCVLLTGDIEAEAEAALPEILRKKPIEVLKVAHHGSRTSTTSEFLTAVRPRHAWISAGAENRYGLPHPEVLARLEGVGAQILRTDREGQIEVQLTAWPVPSRWSAIQEVVFGSKS